MTVELREFDVARYLDSPRATARYLELAFERGDVREVENALRHVLRALGRKRKALRVAATSPLTLPLLWQAARALELRVALLPDDQCE